MAQAGRGIFGPFETEHGGTVPPAKFGFELLSGHVPQKPGLLGRVATTRRPVAVNPANRAFFEEQARFRDIEHTIARQNSWLAIPAFAPVAAVVGIEAASGLAARIAAQTLKPPPLILKEPDPYPRVGDNWATRKGRLAHNAFKQKVQAKAPNWKSEKSIDGTRLKPDATINHRAGVKAGESRFHVELKPKTRSVRRAAIKAVEKYSKRTNQKTRAVFYDPKNFK